METVGLVVLIAVALGFDFTNGFHDAANAIATSVSTRALTPRAALALAAVFNLAGSLVSVKVANTVGSIIDAPETTHGLVVVFAAVVGAIAWNLITWYFGLPSSSSHALIGGLVGAALASGSVVHWAKIVNKVIIPMIVSPLVGFVGALWSIGPFERFDHGCTGTDEKRMERSGLPGLFVLNHQNIRERGGIG